MAFNLNGMNINQLANKLNSQNAMGSSEAKQQAAANADLTKQGGLEGVFARIKEGGGNGLLKKLMNKSTDDKSTDDKSTDDKSTDDKSKKKKAIEIDMPEEDTSFNPQLQSSSLGSDAHLKDFFLACYTDNPYLKNIIKTKLMQEYFNN